MSCLIPIYREASKQYIILKAIGGRHTDLDEATTAWRGPWMGKQVARGTDMPQRAAPSIVPQQLYSSSSSSSSSS